MIYCRNLVPEKWVDEFFVISCELGSIKSFLLWAIFWQKKGKKKKMMSSKEFWTKKTLIGLGLGQFLSLLITSTGFSSSELSKKGAFFFSMYIVFIFVPLNLFFLSGLSYLWELCVTLSCIDCIFFFSGFRKLWSSLLHKFLFAHI